ncbi:MAG: hypothetical protein AAFX87_01725 [Bacteroidota bacterium]
MEGSSNQTCFNPKDFAGPIEEANGRRIMYFRALCERSENAVEPILFWLQTDDLIWHRFFIDAWMLHWALFEDNKETQELREEDFEFMDNDIIRDLIKEYDLSDKKIVDAQMNYRYVNALFCGQLKLSIEDGRTIILNDFNDVFKSNLIISDQAKIQVTAS